MFSKFKSFCFVFALFVLIIPISEVNAQIPFGASFWLRADTGVTQFNNVVSEWKDQSGATKKSAFQLLPISQPTYLPVAINKLPALHFDGRYNYMDCPPIFPASKDHTISIVTRISTFGRNNQLVSGNAHSLYISPSGFVTLMNDTVGAKAVASFPLEINQPALITITYEHLTKKATVYVDGDFAGSAVVSENKDSVMYLGAYQGASSLLGDLAEIVFYRNVLTDTVRKELESYLRKKYAIPPHPAPDSIYSAIPKHLQFFAREWDDSAAVNISGNIYDAGFDSIYVECQKDGVIFRRLSMPLKYEDGKAHFSFAPRIHAELSEYSFLLALKSQTEDKRIGFRDSIVCGDVYLINGQSNSIANNLGYTNEFFRTYGHNFSQNPADTLWEIASTDVSFGGGAQAGSIGVRLQELIMNTYHIPICIINGGVGGTSITLHQRDKLNPENLSTIYGSMLYRVNKSGLAKKAKALLWYQGESDVYTGYADYFKSLYSFWRDDYPNLQKIYVVQVRPGCTAGFGADVRDFLRTVQDSFPDVESFSTMGIVGHDGCHFAPEGYSQIGDQIFKLVARNFYGSSDNSQIRSPNIVQAYYTSSSHTRIGLRFAPYDTRFVISNDTVIGGVIAKIKDYFYLNDTGQVVESVSTHDNRIFLDLKQPSSAKLITYLPDKYYDNTTIIYEGPWLTNTRGVGAFSFYHVPIVDSAQAGIAPKDFNDLSLSAYPNPADRKFTLHYQLSQPGEVSVTISDLLGRTSAHFEKGMMSEGKYEEIFETKKFKIADGVYVCKLQIGNNIKTTMLIIHH